VAGNILWVRATVSTLCGGYPLLHKNVTKELDIPTPVRVLESYTLINNPLATLCVVCGGSDGFYNFKREV
jgi:hypothetical protein